MKKDDGPVVRQVVISSLNESVSILSGYEAEDVNFLAAKALDILKQVKQGNDGKER